MDMVGTKYMLISVIVPIYNTEKYVRYAIEDICNQTYKNIEIILIDDGSTDSSGTICDEYAEEDNRIAVYHTENRGVSAARNLGIKCAKGMYLYFLDSDDRIHPKTVEMLLLDALENECEIVQANGIDFNDDKVAEALNQMSIVKQHTRLLSREQMCLGMMDGSIEAATVVQNKLFLSSLFGEDVLFKEGRIHEDVDIMYRLYWKCKKIGYNESKLFYYRRKRPGSIMNSKYNVDRLNIIQVEKDRYDFFINAKEKELCEQALKCMYLSAINCIERLHESDIPNKVEYMKNIFDEILHEYPSILVCGSVKLRIRMKIICKLLICRYLIYVT